MRGQRPFLGQSGGFWGGIAAKCGKPADVIQLVSVSCAFPAFILTPCPSCPFPFFARGSALANDSPQGGPGSATSPDELRAMRRAAFIDGARAIAPALIATGIWGLVTGVAMVKSGLTESMALAMTLLVYAGSAQLTALPLIATGAPLWLIFAAGLVVNVRFLIFGAALHPYFRTLPWPRRLALGYFSTDMSFVMFMPRFGDARERGTVEQRWFFIGAITMGWFAWQSTSIIGILLGSAVPPDWSLDFAAVLALMAVVLPLLKTRPVLVSAIAAGGVAWAGQPLPLRLGLALAVIAGVAAGMWAENHENKRKGR